MTVNSVSIGGPPAHILIPRDVFASLHPCVKLELIRYSGKNSLPPDASTVLVSLIVLSIRGLLFGGELA